MDLAINPFNVQLFFFFIVYEYIRCRGWVSSLNVNKGINSEAYYRNVVNSKLVLLSLESRCLGCFFMGVHENHSYSLVNNLEELRQRMENVRRDTYGTFNENYLNSCSYSG